MLFSSPPHWYGPKKTLKVLKLSAWIRTFEKHAIKKGLYRSPEKKASVYLKSELPAQ